MYSFRNPASKALLLNRLVFLYVKTEKKSSPPISHKMAPLR